MIIANASTPISRSTIRLTTKQKLIIAPLSDIHHNARAHDRKKFREAIKWITETAQRPDRHIITLLMGDYLDTFSASERAGLRGASLHNSSRDRIEEWMLADTQALIDDLTPIASTVRIVNEGNHTFRWQNPDVIGATRVGWTTGRVLAEAMGAPFVGVCGFLWLDVFAGEKGTTQVPFKIVTHHGFGTATTKGTSINQIINRMKMNFPNCHLYVMGHNHVPIATVQQGIDFHKTARGGEVKIYQMEQAFVRAASFLKGYVEGEACDYESGSYVEERCMVPQGLGIVTCNARWQLDEGGRAKRLVIRVQE